jgi:hypothetical protein
VRRSIPKSMRGKGRSKSTIRRRCSAGKKVQLISVAMLAVLAVAAAAQRVREERLEILSLRRPSELV